ncbi:hypothetical protein SAMN05216436_12423 [bacterium A37T11]|nr:hypothetical protein SAMN05216436_12423 [bacterium A37T11]
MKRKNNHIAKHTCKIALVLVCLIPGIIPSSAQDLSSFVNQKPIAFNGGLELRGIFYNASGIAVRREPFTYLLSGSPTVSLYGWSIPFSFTLSKDDRSFRQPFNQFGLSPTYKWITVHAGYRNVTFSPYTLAGHTMLGGGFELNPGKLRVGFIVGRLNRATVIDTTTQALVPFSFSRKGYAAKLGYGTQANYFDLNFFQAKDDSTSRPDIRIPDSTNVLAEANTSMGYSTRWTIKNFFIESNAAISIYTRDINSPIKLDSIDSDLLQRVKGFFNINGTSEWFLAVDAAAGYKAKTYGLKVNYRRIDPDFKTMGSYFFSNDVENWTIAPDFSLPNGKLRMNASVGIQHDNVRNQKQATNRRFIGSGVLSAEITKQLGLDINYSNFSNNQKPNTLKFADSLKIVQTTQVISLMPRYLIQGTQTSQMIMLSVNISTMDDYNSYYGSEAASRNISTGQYFLNYTISIPAKRLSLFGNLSYTSLKSTDVKNSYQGLSAGGNYTLKNNSLQAGLNTSVMQGDDGTGNKSLIINGTANLNYRFNKIQTLRFSFYITNNNPGSAITGVNPAFTETRGELAYQLNF